MDHTDPLFIYSWQGRASGVLAALLRTEHGRAALDQAYCLDIVEELVAADDAYTHAASVRYGVTCTCSSCLEAAVQPPAQAGAA